jgi:hypothetical protein
LGPSGSGAAESGAGEPSTDVTSLPAGSCSSKIWAEGRLDHGKASGERGCVCFRRHNKNAPPLMASQSGAHAEIVGTSGWQLTGTSVYARRIVRKRWATSEDLYAMEHRADGYELRISHFPKADFGA